MQIELKPDYPVTDDACKAATSKTLAEWSDAISKDADIANKRRDAIVWITEQIGRTTEGVWWATTIWVEHEKRIGRVQKDGRPEGYNICSTKTVAAPVDKVLDAVKAELKDVTRVREGKDIRANWQTPGAAALTDVEVLFAANGAKTGITLNHKRIPSREEADGLRKFWSERLDAMKKRLEA